MNNERKVSGAVSSAIPTVGKLLAEKVIGRRPLSGATRYSYCPYCYKRTVQGNGNLNYKEILKPLWVVTKKMLFRIGENTGKVGYTKEFQCPLCKDKDGRPMVITGSDFIKVYSVPYQQPNAGFIELTHDKIAAEGFARFADEFAPVPELQF